MGIILTFTLPYEMGPTFWTSLLLQFIYILENDIHYGTDYVVILKCRRLLFHKIYTTFIADKIIFLLNQYRGLLIAVIHINWSEIMFSYNVIWSLNLFFLEIVISLAYFIIICNYFFLNICRDIRARSMVIKCSFDVMFSHHFNILQMANYW